MKLKFTLHSLTCKFTSEKLRFIQHLAKYNANAFFVSGLQKINFKLKISHKYNLNLNDVGCMLLFKYTVLNINPITMSQRIYLDI